MSKIVSGQIAMKPRWYFVTGSILVLLGLIGTSIGAIFLLNITLFLLRRHGFMGQWRLEIMLSDFPWWIPSLALISIAVGTWFLKKYDFSYRKNFLLIAIGFITSILVSAWLINYLGINEAWSRQGPMRRFYQRLEQKETLSPNGQGRMWDKNGRGRIFYREGL